MKKIRIVILSFFFLGCTSTQLVSSWTNPEIVVFDAYQVLIVGMSQDEAIRIGFETKLREVLKRRNINAVRSIDLFDITFTSSEKSEKELSEVEQELLQKDFDAILFTKIVGYENKRTFRKKLAELHGLYGEFSEDYRGHQSIYYDPTYYDSYNIYHAETALYCICIDKERELIWRGNIDIKDPINIEKTMDDYIKIIVAALEKQDLVLRKPLRY